MIRGEDRDGVILDGGDCAACNVFEVYGSFTHIEKLTLQNANRALPLRSILVIDKLQIETLKISGDRCHERALRRTRHRLQQREIVGDVAPKQIHQQRFVSAQGDPLGRIQLAEMRLQ